MVLSEFDGVYRCKVGLESHMLKCIPFSLIYLCPWLDANRTVSFNTRWSYMCLMNNERRSRKNNHSMEVIYIHLRMIKEVVIERIYSLSRVEVKLYKRTSLKSK